MCGYIYLTTNLVNGKKYIGRRTSKVFLGNAYLGSGNHLKSAIKKYGRENFNVELLETVDTYEELVKKETEYIIQYNAVESSMFYNHSYGGEKEGFIQGGINIINIPENKAKMIATKTGKPATQKQKDSLSKYAQSHKKEMSDRAKRGYQNMSVETRISWGKKISEANTGRTYPKEFGDKISKHHTGLKMMNNGIKCHWVSPNEFESYLNQGYVFGGLSRNRDYSSKNHPMYGKRGIDNPNYGLIGINNGVIRKKIHKEELENYLNNGWVLGHKLNRSSTTIESVSDKKDIRE